MLRRSASWLGERGRRLAAATGLAAPWVFLQPTTRGRLDLTVAAREYGYALALVGLAGAGLGWRSSRYGRIACATGVFGAAVLAIPLVGATLLARSLPERLAEAFGAPQRDRLSSAKPLQIPRLARVSPILRGKQAIKTVVFSSPDGHDLKLDLYRHPEQGGDLPLIVGIPGGRWQEADRGKFWPLNRHLASRGYAVAALEYRVAPRHKFPAAAEDVRSAVRYLKEKAAEFGVDPNRIVLLGRSAGAQLALLVAYDGADPSIRGVVSLYGPTDLVTAYHQPTPPRLLDVKDALEKYLAGNPKTAEPNYRNASPVNFVGSETPPTLLVHGSKDNMVRPEQSQRLAARLRAASAEHLLLLLPWATHGFDFNMNGPGGQLSTFAIEWFLSVVTR
jgi:acetyl esterase/lipase